MIEQIVYLLRKTNLNLKEIGELTPKKLNAILKELYYQESEDEWRRQNSVANLMASIYNTVPSKRGSKVYKASDFLDSKPTREVKDKNITLESLATAKGIKLPKQ
jgi:hypothetical protein